MHLAKPCEIQANGARSKPLVRTPTEPFIDVEAPTGRALTRQYAQYFKVDGSSGEGGSLRLKAAKKARITDEHKGIERLRHD